MKLLNLQLFRTSTSHYELMMARVFFPFLTITWEYLYASPKVTVIENQTKVYR